MIREMKREDYREVMALWKTIRGFGIRTVDDTEESIAAFLARNPRCSAVAEEDGAVVGTILCGHDGRTGAFYHVCVREDLRGRGICAQMSAYCLARLKEAGINRVTLIAYVTNHVGNAYWKKQGWTLRADFNHYILELSDRNTTVFNP